MIDVAEMGWPSTAERRWGIEKTVREETDICFMRFFKGYYNGTWQIPTSCTSTSIYIYSYCPSSVPTHIVST
jgi:hypothetical protein